MTDTISLQQSQNFFAAKQPEMSSQPTQLIAFSDRPNTKITSQTSCSDNSSNTSIEIKTNGHFTSQLHSPRNPKRHSAEFFKPAIQWFSDYKQLFNIFINSTVSHQNETTLYNDTPRHDMLNTKWEDIDDKQIFKVGFARKLCLSLPITIRHASLTFQDQTTGKFLIIGRQNQQFLRNDAAKNDDVKEHGFTRWMVSHLNFKSLYHFTETQMGNEKHYEFFPGSNFDIEMSNATLTGAQIKTLIKATDEVICSQPYDLMQSNCYSAVIYGLTKAIKLIAGRDVHTNQARNNDDLKSIFTLICSSLHDNHQLGLGGLDNETIVKALNQTIHILQNKRLLHVSQKDTYPLDGQSERYMA